METNKKVLILNQDQINKKITRIAYQILEDNFEEKVIALVGIADRGYVLAKRLKEILQKINPQSETEILLVKLEINKKKSSLDVKTDLPVKELSNKALVLVDDVLSSGRTLAYGVGAFFDIPVKKIRTAVLIDRSHHRFPIFSDFFGMKLSTTLKEHVTVQLRDEEDVDNTIDQDEAWLA